MSTTALDVVRPGDPRYPGVRHLYTATGSPAAVVVPRSAAEVADALAFAREAGAPFTGSGVELPSEPLDRKHRTVARGFAKAVMPRQGRSLRPHCHPTRPTDPTATTDRAFGASKTELRW